MSAILNTGSVRLRQPWTAPLLALGVVIASLCGLYWETLVAMVTIWNRSETFAHAFLVLPISLWLVWRERQSLQGVTPRSEPWMLVPMAVMALLWWLGNAVSVNAVTQFAFVALLVLAIPATLGVPLARRIAFPLVFLFFMVPVGDFMLPRLMEWTADFTIGALQLTGIPVYREGLQFVIPSGSWSVVEACSGVRYMIASFMVGSLYAYLNYVSTKRRLIFCVVSLVVPLVANWLRAYMIVMIGHLSGNTLAVGVDHLIYGWVFFGIVIMLMFMIGARWADPWQAPAGPMAFGARPAGFVESAGRQWGVVATAVLLLAAPHGVNHQQEKATTQSVLPLTLPVFKAAATVPSSIGLEPSFHNPTSLASQSYAVGNASVTVHVAYYRQQRPGSKLVTSVNQLVSADDVTWLRLAGQTRDVTVAGRHMGWRVTELMKGSAAVTGERQRVEVRQIYWVGGHYTASDTQATLQTLKAQVLGRGDDGAMITIFTAGGDPKETAERLDVFTATHLAAIEAQLVAYRAAHSAAGGSH